MMPIHKVSTPVNPSEISKSGFGHVEGFIHHVGKNLHIAKKQQPDQPNNKSYQKKENPDVV
jgi:C4-type Zn-finger protein